MLSPSDLPTSQVRTLRRFFLKILLQFQRFLRRQISRPRDRYRRHKYFFSIRVLRRTALLKGHRRLVCARSPKSCGQGLSSWPRQSLETQSRMPWAFPDQKLPIWFSHSTAKALPSPVSSAPFLKECVTVKTCLRHGSSLRRKGRRKQIIIRNLCCCPRVVRIAFAPRREQA